ncbi:hypothetical protein FJR48_11780 [Sulfurimonas lithotrophica]|uniref:Uncharacterized protein n=1 Tax=Sulfurimonas lithotrophica TaxID=2590022 RepID=A0A5P8P3P6_9BACT|nr:hypothetical protein [Sulfurimonas lithotrophica]QFR50368.1 hypothetical protein FJR48_11780 [Sulfurimonas lithotrophica]
MKSMILTLLIVFNLDASIFSQEEKPKKINIKNSFRENISDANAVIKRGDYTRYTNYQSGIKSTISHIDKLDISSKEKIEIKNYLQKYSSIINKIYKKLQLEAPKFNHHYKESINGLKNFNKKLAGIGYRPILNAWYELSKTKARFIKKPSEKLEKKFHEKWRLIMINITELYLDEEIEAPLFAYLENYKAYFNEISLAYKSAQYENIKSLKPLCYKIKAKLEFITPLSS